MTSIPKPDFVDSAYAPARFREWLGGKAAGYFAACTASQPTADIPKHPS